MKKIIILLLIGFIAINIGCDYNSDGLTEKELLLLVSNVELSISESEWYTTVDKINDMFTAGVVHLKISGSTNGEKVMIETYGDGIIAKQSLLLDENKNFQQDVIIAFTMFVHNTPMQYKTKIIAYSEAQLPYGNVCIPEDCPGSGFIKEITLESGELKYIE